MWIETIAPIQCIVIRENSAVKNFSYTPKTMKIKQKIFSTHMVSN